MTMRHLTASRLRGVLAKSTAMIVLFGAPVLSSAPALAQVEFDEAELYFELNATDGDVGLHGLLDGEAWRVVTILGETGFWVIRASTGRHENFGQTELFFESNEPPLGERSFADLLARFPEGEYRFTGWTIEGEQLVGSAELTADLPCPPLIDPQVDDDEVIITWELVPGVFDPDTEFCSNEDEGVEVDAVEVVVELETEDVLRVFKADLSPEATEVQVPEAFLEAFFDEVEEEEEEEEEVEAKVEVLVIEESGNRTASEQELDL